MLGTSYNYSKVFFEKKRLFLDSDVLIELSKDEELRKRLNAATKGFSLVYCTVSILEVGFHYNKKKGDAEYESMLRLYGGKKQLDSNSLGVHEFTGEKLNDGFVYNPGYHEWFATRNLLLKHWEINQPAPQNIPKLKNDTLIYMCAYNTQSILITNNIKDHVKITKLPFLNKAKKFKGDETHHLPLFTLDDLLRSTSEDVSYPENIPHRLRG